ncbi:fungal-specific transcription factor domain-containing protein [Mycena vulgaris]|nr:fungal-specific transcription factor domain-containing protein [Mycena vulgaris]
MSSDGEPASPPSGSLHSSEQLRKRLRSSGKETRAKEQKSLKRRNAFLEAKLRSLSICSLCAQPLKSQGDQSSPSANVSVFNAAPNDNATGAEHALAEEDFSHDELADRFRMLSFTPPDNKFFGSASSFVLVSNAIAVKEKYLGRPAAQHPRRPRFWNTLPWEEEEYDQRPQDMTFGAALLAVLGVASRYSDDPRVFVEGDTTLSSGWKFVKQVQTVRKMFEPTLYEVQFYCLMTLFSLGTSAPQSSWLYLGLGIRSLQQRGEHRRKRKDKTFDPEEEQWKRAFWSIFSLDRLVCFFSGRPAGFHSEDYDVDLPLEVDDEYWEHGCTQPLEKPSLLSYFVCYVRLCEILGDALRRLYASNKSKILMGWTGPEWEQRAVAELDSAMNNWLDTVPSHLHWDSDRTADAFFDQSAVLYTTYYYIQIGIHRPYIHKDTALASPSLSICTSAARSGLHISDAWLRKAKRLPPQPMLMNSVFVSGLILLLNIFGIERAGLAIEKNKDLLQVGTAMEFLKFSESRWQSAGRIWELLQEVKSLDGLLSRRGAPKDELHSADTTSKVGIADPSMGSSSVFLESAGMPQHEFYSQSFEPAPTQLWDGMPSSHPLVPSELEDGNDPKAAISIDQLLVDTAEFDTINLSPNSAAANGWSDSSELPNVILDDELMSLWMAAPTDFS